MAVTLDEQSRAIIDATNFATLATLNPDGSPQTSVVWVGRDGDDLLFSTLVGRRKEKNLRRDPRVSVSILDSANPYAYLEVRGTVTLTEDGGRELINALARKYTGQDYAADGPDDVRVVIRLTPQKVFSRG
ncbi:PPOX class F420-dependent oxidoreductase [Goodfellowiella coeruleoviolacea]|uniref:PPOX class probable F420-dependent enzyme n=1 Tax=Goodfellowiella coeruleoviolacea TaxID=334858 RepID=A0AAE3KDZ8_9PSEU|nr:PPOX class F420-dependent oxidoreductase [Goodfellowiella coeruleoviolacea]MCP2164721.1 PPOX class probable F420-dependent enzyme [Goodfellowiella coeruleoviolacea]